MRKDYTLEKRKYVIGSIILTIVIIYIIRLFILQVGSTEYKKYADNNAFLRKIQYPSRGMIYDRNNNLIVYNQPAYDVMMIPRDVEPFDTLDFCKTLNITKEQYYKRIADMKNPVYNPGYSSYTPQTFMTQLSAQDYGRLQEKLYRYPGFYIQNRVIREYNTDYGANILGNIREVRAKEVEENPYYIPGDYVGDLGIEKSYEEYLRGVKGEEILIRDAKGRIKGKYEDGKYDIDAVSGKNLHMSIDMKLQEYGEKLMQNKIGAIVCIEPETGEILAIVSSPNYNPKLMTGRNRGDNYKMLSKDPTKPLLDRALQGRYPPGSTFKTTQALIFLQEGIIQPSTAFACHHGFVSGRLRVGCHSHGSPLSLLPALQTSCNAYFCYGLKSMIDRRSKYGSCSNALETWKNHLVSQGFGYRLGVDLPGENRGFIPNSKFYDKYYGANHWSALTVISIAIGQGEVLATPIQIANLAATIANRGWYITPHVVKEIEDSVLPAELLKKHNTKTDSKYYNSIVQGMRMAVTGGTCRKANLRDIEVCGKTGTAQNPHGRDHSAFMGFAPMNNPKIAVVAYVENAGFGAAFGVPIGALMMEMYLKGEISPEHKAMETQMLESNTIIYSGVKKH